ncbi:MAG: molybdate ABC transporter permease subunit [Candidatus Bipolaricaulia bacterium]
MMLSTVEWQAFWLSFKVASVSVAGLLVPGIALSWILAKTRIRGKTALDTLATLPLVLPPVVTGYVLLVLFSRRGPFGSLLYRLFGWEIAFTWPAAALASAVIAFPLFVRAVQVAMEGIDPKLEQAARTLGNGPWYVFFTVTLPLSARGVIAGAILAFSRSLGEFGATIMVAGNIPGRTQTIPLAIFNAVQIGQEGSAVRLILVVTILAFLTLYLTQWLLARGEARVR